jgi:hypothetical protein
MIGGSGTAMSAISGTLGMGPTRAPASASAPPANFALSVEPGTMPGTVDVTKSFTLGPLAASKDHFYFFVTGPTGTSVYSSPNGSVWVPEIGPDGFTSTAVPVQASDSNASGSPSATTAAAATSSGKAPSATASPQPAPSGGATVAVITGRPVVMQAISDGHGGIIATGKVTNASGDNGMIWHMTQTGVWQQVAFEDDTPTEFSSITNGVSGYVASSDKGGGAQIMYSSDGDSWQASAITVGSGFALTVSTYRYGYLAVGTDATRQGATTAWSSPDGRTWTLRNDWHLPPNVTALFGIGNFLVATANTTVAVSTASPGKSAAASASPTPKASATPVAAPVQLTTWWSSATGVVWQQAGLQTTAGGWAVINGEILVMDASATPQGSWSAWSSPDGKTWQRPAADRVSFAGSRTCTIASLDTGILMVSWEAPGTLKAYFGKFLPQ